MVGGGKDREEMREILFKAKKLNGSEWVIGSYVHTFNEDKKCPVVGVMTENHWIVEINGNMILIDKETICQYTGLTDKNGNKIWENDIIATDCGNVRVIYSAEPSPFENSFYVGFEVLFSNITDNENYRHDLGYWSVMRGFEVIGNTFDNADLLKGE